MEASYNAIREALEDSQSLLEGFSRGEYGAQVREQMRDNSAALAIPTRNCERLSNSTTAIESYQNETGLNKHPVALWTAKQIYAFIDWLFATRKEQQNDIRH